VNRCARDPAGPLHREPGSPPGRDTNPSSHRPHGAVDSWRARSRDQAGVSDRAARRRRFARTWDVAGYTTPPAGAARDYHRAGPGIPIRASRCPAASAYCRESTALPQAAPATRPASSACSSGWASP
jgi:hypothetical protein